MDVLPKPSTRLTFFNLPVRYKDRPIKILHWKLALIAWHTIVCILYFLFRASPLNYVYIVPIAYHLTEVVNLQWGPWGKPNEGLFFCDVHAMIIRGDNIVRLVGTCIAEALLAFLRDGRWSAFAIVLHARFDAVRYIFPEATEQALYANDLEALHAAQPPRDASVTPDIVFPVALALLWYTHPTLLIHFACRAALTLARDLGVVSPTQHEMYADILSGTTLLI